MLLAVGVILAGLFLGLRDLAPYLAARRTGVIVRRGALAKKVERETDPDGFARLLANRSKGATLGFGILAAGCLLASLTVLQIVGFGGPLALLIFAVYVGFTIFAAVCLVRGFSSGRMYSFWSLSLFGDAKRTENPTWFWTYAAINVAIVVIGASTVLRACAG